MPETAEKTSIPMSVKDDRFDPSRCADYCLSLQVEASALTVAVFDNIHGTYLALETHAFRNSNDLSAMLPKLEKLCDAHDWLGNRFKRVDAMVVTERSTLVPSALFDQAKAAEYLQFNHSAKPLDVHPEDVRTDHLRNLDARNLWLMPAALERTLKKLFPGLRISHYSTPLIESLLVANKNEQKKKVFAHVQQERFEILVLEGRKLHLYNTFKYRGGEDFLFYLLFVCEQLKLSPETLELVLLGELTGDSTVAGFSKKYVRNVQFGERPVQAAFGKAFDVVPPHFHYNLFSLHYFS